MGIEAAVASEALGGWFGVETLGAEALGGELLAGEALGGSILAGEAAAGMGAGVDALGWGAGAFDVLGAESAMASMATGLFDTAGTAGFDMYGAPAFDWGGVKGALQIAGPAMSIGSGIMGMDQASQLRKMAALSGAKSDPWGTSGGRGLADQQLQELMRNPGGVAENDPAYKLRIQAAQRAMGPMGQGSGAMAVAGANASTDWLNQRMATLGGMAGANVSPAAGASSSLTGDIAATDLMSKSLASIGYGVTRGTGGGTAMPPAVQEWFRQQGFANG